MFIDCSDTITLRLEIHSPQLTSLERGFLDPKIIDPLMSSTVEFLLLLCVKKVCHCFGKLLRVDNETQMTCVTKYMN